MNTNDKESIVRRIRTRYTENEHAGLKELKALDAKAKRPALVFTYIFGSLGAIVMGAGMSLVMTDIGTSVGIAEPIVAGIVTGAVGMAAVIVNYPIYKVIMSSRRRKFADRIIELSDGIMTEKNEHAQNTANRVSVSAE